MPRTLRTEPLTASAFAPFGDVLDCAGSPDRIINQGLCGRFHDRARLDFGTDGRAGVSLFLAQPRTLPYPLEMVERHPDGAQSFIPMHEHPFLVITAPDIQGQPGIPRAFLTDGTQGINLHRGIWHGVLTPLAAPGRFAVVDRIGPGENLEEHWFDTPWTIIQSTDPG
ncbi:ureidoglycolate lyase [Rhodobacteraceae bacterium 2376]|uniref:Ureidoglycolate lyase n=1 Tax=Rhabdonatronobacter sediminivivens TaxID=2743469 RepID=A0A7Z0L1I9_9RHOB|nr:ureidoglycolate lyase [Rhabdonatronobacter sediminivivens]NYS25913.1 ureidoglycolate lyase [Rhabdonatronobacter sediminivivens]